MDAPNRFKVCKLAALAEHHRLAGDAAAEERAIRAAAQLPGITWEVWSQELLGVRRIRARVAIRAAQKARAAAWR